MARYPVFIVGSPRSGTSILVDALLMAGYKGFREGRFLSLIRPIDQLIERHYSSFFDNHPKILLSGIPKDLIKRRLFSVLVQTVSELNPAAPWFDKTGDPNMIMSVPALREMWPESVFIFAKRRALENVASRIKKFPVHGFEYHCSDWAKNMAAWRDVRRNLTQNDFVEIDQQDMIQRPEVVARILCSFLQLSAGKEETLLSTFTSNRPQETESGSARRLHSLSSLDWPAERIKIFLKHCRPEMEAYGYSMDETYYAKAVVRPERDQ